MFDWTQFPLDPVSVNAPNPSLPTGGYTGQGVADPSQLQAPSLDLGTATNPNAGITGGMYPQVIVKGPNGWWKSSPDPNAPWHGPSGETLPPGTNPPGYQDPYAKLPTDGGNGSGGGDTSMSAFSQAWLASPYPGTVDGLKQFVAANPQYGVTLGGSKGDKVYGPGGTFWGDAVIAAGLGGQGKSALNGDTGGGSTSSTTGSDYGAYLTPYDKQYALPTLAELQNMPGYQAQLAAGQQATERSAAAKGTLLTGGTQKALQQNANDIASQNYYNLANLGMGAFNTNYDIFRNNQTDPFNKLLSTSQLGMNAASQPTVGPTTAQTQSESSYQLPSPSLPNGTPDFSTSNFWRFRKRT